MKETLTLAGAGIISTCLQGMLYGLSLFMYTLTLWILARNRRKRGLNYGMIGAGAALLILSTVEFALNIYRLYFGLVLRGPHNVNGVESFFRDVLHWTFFVKGILYNVQTLVLDGVVIYRAYVVWQHAWWVIVVPTIGWLGLAVCTVGSNLTLSHATDDTGNVFAAQTGRWLIAIYSTTLGTNLSATIILAYRIWVVSRKSAAYTSGSQSSLSVVLRVVIESGAIYSFTIVAGLATFLAHSPGAYVLLDLTSPIISIVFCMIIVRVGFATDNTLSGSAPGMYHSSGSAQLDVGRSHKHHQTGRANQDFNRGLSTLQFCEREEEDAQVYGGAAVSGDVGRNGSRRRFSMAMPAKGARNKGVTMIELTQYTEDDAEIEFAGVRNVTPGGAGVGVMGGRDGLRVTEDNEQGSESVVGDEDVKKWDEV